MTKFEIFFIILGVILSILKVLGYLNFSWIAIIVISFAPVVYEVCGLIFAFIIKIICGGLF